MKVVVMYVFFFVSFCSIFSPNIAFTIRLLKPNSLHTELEVDELGMEFLSRFSEPLEIVSIVGPYHSGKSYLLNNILGLAHPGKDGFEIGATVKATTEGIYSFMQPLKVQEKNGGHEFSPSILFIDSEGFGARNVSSDYDAKVFAVSTLLSSHLLYNGIKNIDSTDVDLLELFAHKTKMFYLKAAFNAHSSGKNNDPSIDSNAPVFQFPPMTWVINDWSLSFEKGQTATSYVQAMIHGNRKTDNLESKSKEEIKSSLGHLFPEIFGFTLPAPTEKAKDIARLQELEQKDLDEDYRNEIGKLRDHICQSLMDSMYLRAEVDRQREMIAIEQNRAAVQIAASGDVAAVEYEDCGEKICPATKNTISTAEEIVSAKKSMVTRITARTGPQIAHMLRVLVAAANAGQMPKLPNTWNAIVEMQARDAKLISVQTAQIRISNYQNPIDPYPAATFLNFTRLEEAYSANMFENLVLGLSGAFVSQMRSEVKEEVSVIMAKGILENNRIIKQFCDEKTAEFKVKFFKFVEQLPVPQPSTQLDNLLTESSRKELESFSQEFESKFSKTEISASILDLKNTMQLYSKNIIIANNAALDSILHSAKAKAIQAFTNKCSADFNKNDKNEPLASADILRMKETTVELAREVFAREAVKASREQYYAVMLESTLSSCHNQFKVFEAQNIDNLIAKVTNVVATLKKLTADHYYQQSKPMSRETEKLVASQQRKIVVNDFNRQLASFMEHSVVSKDGKRKLNEMMDELDRKLREDNEKAFQEVYKQPLKHALKEARLVSSQYNTIYTFKKQIKRFALENIQEAQELGGGAGFKISDELMVNTVDNWLKSREVEELCHGLMNRGWFVVAVAGICFVVMLYVGGKVIAFGVIGVVLLLFLYS